MLIFEFLLSTSLYNYNYSILVRTTHLGEGTGGGVKNRNVLG